MADTEVRWLSEEEQKAWRTFLEFQRVLQEALQSQLQRDAGIPHTYYEILVRLSEAPGRRMRMTQLSEQTLQSKSALSHACARLEERGWIRRVECSDDRRGLLAELTDEGFRALECMAPGHVTNVRESLFDALTDEQVHQLRQISEAVVRRLGGQTCDG
ncbi:MAG TPA: MarR family transcriptional regulator [Mycobacteriales bacterium]|nr:MarR family transcriptional regulator [Mycobacteriales bacterium]